MKSQIETTYLTKEIRVGKILEHKHRLIHVKVNCHEHKLDILRKSPSLKGTRIFIKEDLIPKEEAQLRKEVQRVKDERKVGKWEIIRNKKVFIIYSLKHE